MAKFTSGKGWRDILTGNVKTEKDMIPMAQGRANETGVPFYIWDANAKKAGFDAKWRLTSDEPTHLKRRGIPYTTIEPEEL